ncbi:VCBS repeat-containing protein [Marispirochaeta aestuarii]|uniref:FG-GAP repeat domain-containing protein n=1 Tax=Marispirochaeta aestuarii TaxID=1963862 RepID=UPI002ABDB3B2|nr:VCBS repeat-containing protein [Marispirochaeta aestuarii]
MPFPSLHVIPTFISNGNTVELNGEELISGNTRFNLLAAPVIKVTTIEDESRYYKLILLQPDFELVVSSRETDYDYCKIYTIEDFDSFELTTLIPDTNATDISLGYMDDDEKLDLLFYSGMNYTIKSSFFLNQGRGNFLLSNCIENNGIRSNYLADFDTDGDTDAFFIFHDDSTAFIYKNDRYGNFSEFSELPISNFELIDFADFDNDGDVDIVAVPDSMVHYDDTPLIFYNDGSGKFDDYEKLPYPSRFPDSIVIGDLNNDFLNDIVFISVNIIIYMNQGNKNFERIEPGLTNMWINKGRLIDIDGDQDLDILTGGKFAGRISVGLNEGDGNFSDDYSVEIQGTDSIKNFFPADFNHDGYVDILAYCSNGYYQIILNNGDLTFTNKSINDLGDDFWYSAVANLF